MLKVGSKRPYAIRGIFRFGVWNENGDRWIESCQENSVFKANTFFNKLKDYIWTSLNGQSKTKLYDLHAKIEKFSSVNKNESWWWLQLG